MGARIRLCGRLEVEIGGERLEGRLPGRQGPLVLAILVLGRYRPVTRHELIAALWADESPADPEEALSALLSKVRRAVGKERLAGRRELTLVLPEGARVDVEEAHAAADAARDALAAGDPRTAWTRSAAALDVTAQPFLVGHDAPWVQERRRELDDVRLRALELQAQAGLRLGGAHGDRAEAAARELVAAAPLREAGHRLRMELLAARGEIAEALAAYEELRVLLRDELGTAPGDATRALHERLLTGVPGPATATNAPARMPDRLEQALAAPWVGREELVGRLIAAAEDAAGGSAGLVLVSGDGGVGKTRLVAEVAARLDGFRVLYGRCDEHELSPYGPWVDIVRAGLADLPTGHAGAPDLARLVPDLAARLDDPRPPAATADAEAQRSRLFEAVASVLRALAATRPTLLVLDDLHWADRSSLLLTRHLARDPRLGATLVVGTFRDSDLAPSHPLRELLADLPRDRDVPRLHLGGMAADDVVALIAAWHGEAVADATARAIHAETAGNPFFVKQLVRHLAESGGLDGPPRTGGFGVPQGVRDVIAQRVARLPDRAGDVLHVAALIGRDFELDLLEDVLDLGGDAVLDVLDAAVHAALVTEVAGRPGRYSFAHALLRTAIEAELTAARRARWHRRIGEAIERRHRDRLGPWLDDLARHFGEASPQELDRAVDYAVRAARQAESRLAYDEAVRLMQQAVELRRRDPAVDRVELAGLERALAAAQSLAGRWEAARATFARAAAAARVAGAAGAFADAALGYSGGTWEQYGTEDAAAIALLEEALDRLGPGDSAPRAKVLARLAMHTYFVVGAPPDRVTALADEAVAIARRLGDVDALVSALAGAQHARWRPGQAAERLPLAAELVEVTEARGTLSAAAEAHLWRAIALLELCRLDEADAHLRRHAELAEATQQQALLIQRDMLRSTRALLEGDYDRGARAARTVVDWAEREEEHDRAPTPIHAQSHGAHAVSLLNETGELARLTPLFERLAAQSVPPSWQAALAWSHVQAGRAREARALLHAIGGTGFADLPRDSNFLSRLAQVAHAVGELGDPVLAGEVEPLLAPYDDLWVVFGPAATTLGPVAYAVGVLQLVQGRADAAVASFEKALALSERMRARPYVGRSKAGLGQALRRRGDPADAARAERLLAEAADLARALGMRRLERELE